MKRIMKRTYEISVVTSTFMYVINEHKEILASIHLEREFTRVRIVNLFKNEINYTIRSGEGCGVFIEKDDEDNDIVAIYLK